MNFKSLTELMDLSIKHDGESQELNCDITLVEDNITYQAYTVSVANRDLLFYCDKGTINYVIDSYGDDDYLTCFSIKLD